MDWNLFFTSYVQCAAALIGLIGAFSISKLLGESEKTKIADGEIDKLIIQYNELCRGLDKRYFEWHDENRIKYSPKVKDAIKKKEFANLSDEEKLSKLSTLIPIYKTETRLQSLNTRIAELTPIKAKGFNGISLASPVFPDIIPPNMFSELNEEKELIEDLIIKAESLIEHFNQVKVSIAATKKNLRPLTITLWILSFGLLLTVIYPLHFIPLKNGELPILSFSVDSIIQNLFSMRGLFLIALTLIVEGIFGYFIWLLRSLKQEYSVLEKRLIDNYFKISGYSQYLDEPSN